jgi:hypothetical protein
MVPSDGVKHMVGLFAAFNPRQDLVRNVLVVEVVHQHAHGTVLPGGSEFERLIAGAAAHATAGSGSPVLNAQYKASSANTGNFVSLYRLS